MPRRSILKVVKVNYTPSAPWMVRVPARLQSTEGSQKKFFEKESVAKAYAERLARQMGEYQTQALGLTDRQKVEAAECYRILGKEDASLLEAVHHYVAYLAQAKQSAPVGQLFEEFLAAKRQDGLSSKYLADLRSKLGRFVAAFSDTLACNLTAPTLEAWLRGLKMGSVSRESYRRNISVMLEFGRRRGALRVNPAADIKITRRPEGEVTILTPEDVARLLECCPSDLRPYVAICAFAGLRPSEAASLDWSNKAFDVGTLRAIDVAVGDKLLVRANARHCGLINGQVLTVKSIQPDRTIHTQEGVAIPANFQHWSHGYVVTSHKAQGRTCDHVVVAAERLDAKSAYVACSRGRVSCSVHTPDKEELLARLPEGTRRAALDVLGKTQRPTISASIMGRTQAWAGVVRHAVERSVSGIRKRMEQARQLVQRWRAHAAFVGQSQEVARRMAQIPRTHRTSFRQNP